jgi:thioredoxin-related protein
MSNFFSCALLSLLFYCGSFFPANHHNDPIHFRYLSFTKAKAEAELYQKKVFTYCWAPWCTDCQKMEEYTFIDAALSQYINDEFLAVKVDIHSALGKEWVKEFNITSLPTFLILDKQGALLQRLETSLNSKDLFEVLQASTSTPQIAAVLVHPDTFEQESTTAATQQLLSAHHSVKLLLDTVKTERVDNPAVENEAEVSGIVPKEQAMKTNIEKITPVKKMFSNGAYKIQLGQFTDYTKASTIIKQLQSRFNKEIFLKIEAKGHYKTYRILVLGFANQKEASDFLLALGDLDLVWSD